MRRKMEGDRGGREVGKVKGREGKGRVRNDMEEKGRRGKGGDGKGKVRLVKVGRVSISVSLSLIYPHAYLLLPLLSSSLPRLVRSLVRVFVRPSWRPFVHLPVPSFARILMSCVCARVCLLVGLFVCLFVCLYVCSIVRLLVGLSGSV